jgi:hypothetical protein
MDIKIQSPEFLNEFKDNLFKNFFGFDSRKTREFIDFLKEHNVSIGGEYITALLYNITDSEYNLNSFGEGKLSKPDPVLYISNKYAENFILNFYPGFIIVENSLFKTNSNYYYNNYFQQIMYSFKNKNEMKSIKCIIYKENTISNFLKSISMSLFEIWWDPISNNININNIDLLKKSTAKVNNNLYNWYQDNKYSLFKYCKIFESKKEVTIIPPRIIPPKSLTYIDIEKK